MIDVLGGIGKYQRVHCSDYFSSIELIPMETRDDCLLNTTFKRFAINDSIIVMYGNYRAFVFDRTGKFLNQIGERGQGPGEYQYGTVFFLNTAKSTIFIEDLKNILEYDYKGKYIRSIIRPNIGNSRLSGCFYVGDNLFIGNVPYNGKNKYKYCLFDQQGDTVKGFYNHIFFDRNGSWVSTLDDALPPFCIDNRVFLKDYVNDTIYVLEHSEMRPAYVFGFGKYSFPKDQLERSYNSIRRNDFFKMSIDFSLMGTPKFFFYRIFVPDIFSRPKSKPYYQPATNEFKSADGTVYGIYDIEKRTNILLDTDEYFQKGMINDINGGLPFVPIYYAENGEVVGVWNPDDMKEMLTEDYFAKQKIKDQEAHQKLRELLKIFKIR